MAPIRALAFDVYLASSRVYALVVVMRDVMLFSWVVPSGEGLSTTSSPQGRIGKLRFVVIGNSSTLPHITTCTLALAMGGRASITCHGLFRRLFP